MLAACLLDAQAPPWGPNDLMDRLKFCELQHGDPIPNPHLEGLDLTAQPLGVQGAVLAGAGQLLRQRRLLLIEPGGQEQGDWGHGQYWGCRRERRYLS